MPEPAPEKLREFLFRLVLDSDLRNLYADSETRDAAVDQSDLNDYMKDVMRRGDLDEILKELAEEAGIAPGDHFI